MSYSDAPEENSYYQFFIVIYTVSKNKGSACFSKEPSMEGKELEGP
jgi:hypothetical protein